MARRKPTGPLVAKPGEAQPFGAQPSGVETAVPERRLRRVCVPEAALQKLLPDGTPAGAKALRLSRVEGRLLLVVYCPEFPRLAEDAPIPEFSTAAPVTAPEKDNAE